MDDFRLDPTSSEAFGSISTDLRELGPGPGLLTLSIVHSGWGSWSRSPLVCFSELQKSRFIHFCSEKALISSSQKQGIAFSCWTMGFELSSDKLWRGYF